MIPLSTETKARIGNRITILIPARKYIMNLAWTEEKPMPAIELFACRLLIHRAQCRVIVIFTPHFASPEYY